MYHKHEISRNVQDLHRSIKVVQIVIASNSHMYGNQLVDYLRVLLDFSLTVKASTLIFISGRGSAISSDK